MAGEEQEVPRWRGEMLSRRGKSNSPCGEFTSRKENHCEFRPVTYICSTPWAKHGAIFPFRKFSKTPSWKVEILSSCLGSRRFFIRTKWMRKKSRNARETRSIFFNVCRKISRDKSLDRTSPIIGISTLVSRDLYFIGDVDFRLVSRNGWTKFVRRKFNQLDNSRFSVELFSYFSVKITLHEW